MIKPPDRERVRIVELGDARFEMGDVRCGILEFRLQI